MNQSTRHRLWRKKNKRRINKYRREYKQRNYLRVMLTHVKSRAKKLGIPFCLSIDDVEMPQTCPALGISFAFDSSGRIGIQDATPSLDRINPQLGYVKGNVRVISFKANAIKRNATLDELRGVVAYVERELGVDAETLRYRTLHTKQTHALLHP